MTKTLEQAIERLQQLPAERQERLAQLLLHELDEDQRWLDSTAAGADKLRGLVDEVLEADRRGECEPLDPDRL
jgi:hypothetical protein